MESMAIKAVKELGSRLTTNSAVTHQVLILAIQAVTIAEAEARIAALEAIAE